MTSNNDSVKKLGGLVVTDVLLVQSQTCLWREERGQNMILVALNDPKTNENGHLLYCLETDKRDCLEEEAWTDNPKLFANEHPEADELQELFCLSGNAERTEAVNEVLGACWEGSGWRWRSFHKSSTRKAKLAGVCTPADRVTPPSPNA